MLDEGKQTVFTKYILSAKVETIILKNEASTVKDQKSKIMSSLSYVVIHEDPGLMKHSAGLTPSQFEVLYLFQRFSRQCKIYTALLIVLNLKLSVEGILLGRVILSLLIHIVIF